jgi:hypothetical protein
VVKMQINLIEPSTQRGIVWVITGAIGIAMSLFGLDPTPVLSMGSAVAGGMGMLTPDLKKEPPK